MNLIFVLAIIVGCPFAAVANSSAPILVQPYKIGKSSTYAVSSRGYEDARIFDKKSKNIKYWLIKSQNLKIEKFYKNGILEEYRASQLLGNTAKEINYVRRAGKLVLAKAVKRPAREMAGQIAELGSENICKIREDLVKTLGTVSQELSMDVCAENLESKIIDPNCKTVYPNGGYKKMVDSYLSNLAFPANENPILICLGDPKTAEVLSKACALEEEEAMAQLEIVALRYKINASKFYAGPQLIEKKVSCNQTKPGPSAITEENGHTTYFLSAESNQSKISSKEMEKLVAEELLHGAGVSSETNVKNLVNICVEKISDVKCDKVVDVKPAKAVAVEKAQTRRILDPDQTGSVQQEIAQNSDVKIGEQILSGVPQTLPDSGPTTDALAQSAIASSAGASSADFGVDSSPSNPVAQAMFQSSLSMTSGPIATAKTLLSLAGSSISTAIASTTSFRGPASERTTVPKIKDYSAKTRFNEVAYESSDEEVKNTTEGIPRSVGPKSKKQTNNDLAEVGNTQIESTSSNKAIRTSSTRSSSSSSRDSSIIAKKDRSVASVNSNPEQLKIARLIEEAPYAAVKNELANKDFIKKLELNNISIIRKVTQGQKLLVQKYGARNGSIVYADNVTEAKFVREK